MQGRQTKLKPLQAFKWFDGPHGFQKVSQKIVGNENGEVIERLKNEISITALFKNIISLNMIVIIAYYTNKRINIKMGTNKQKEVTVTEIFAYIGLLILFGLGNKNDVAIDLLWSEKSLVQYSHFVNATMSRDRFQLISRYIAFDDVDTRENRKENKFHKMEATFNMFKKALNLIIPSFFLCIDETLYGFRGCCSFRQFIPSKPARYGIKFWCLVDVKIGKTTSFAQINNSFIFVFIKGYLVDVNVYLGKNNAASQKEAQIGKKAVLLLMEKYFNTNRCLCADNFFSSISLCKELWVKGIEYIGTIRANKIEIPKTFLKDTKRPVGTSLFAFQSELTLASYVPKKDKAVILVSKMHHDPEIDEETNKPKMILDYNKLKGLS